MSMNFLADFFLQWKHYKEFKKKNQSRGAFAFYSERAADQVHFKDMLHILVQKYGYDIIYLASKSDDPFLTNQVPGVHAFYIGEGFFRTIVFRVIDVEVFAMTLPDLENYYLKKSVNPVHYVYIFHSICSTHMIYQEAAFDHYDTIFCVGPYHIHEIKSREAACGLPSKELFEHGYARLDEIIQNHSNKESAQNKGQGRQSVLVAPTWGEHSITNTCAIELIGNLLKADFDVVFRPHPMSVRKHPDLMKKIKDAFKDNPGFVMETDVATTDSLFNSCVMVSEWSGAALEYAFGLLKPVVFIDTPPKVNNPKYDKDALMSIEMSLREKLGCVVKLNELGQTADFVKDILSGEKDWAKDLVAIRDNTIFNIGQSAEAGAEKLHNMFNHLKTAKK